MKTTLLIFSLILANLSFTQGVNFGVSSGTQFFKLEGGYSMSENIHVGAYYSPGFDFVYRLPMSTGAFARYTFELKNVIDNSWFNFGIRPFLGANLGVIHRKEGYDLINLNSEVQPAETNLGYAISGGVEMLYGREAKWGTFFEFSLGKTPNVFKTLTSISTTALYGEDTTIEEPDGTGFFSANFGFRFYF